MKTTPPAMVTLNGSVPRIPNENDRQASVLLIESGDQSNDRYATLCCCHIRKCAMVIGILELIIGMIGFAVLIIEFVALKDIVEDSEEHHESNHQPRAGVFAIFMIGFTGCFIFLLVVPLMMYGVKNQKSKFLLPHMLVSMIAIVGYFVRGLLLLVEEISEYTADKHHPGKHWHDEIHPLDLISVKSLLASTFITGSLLECFFLFVVTRCYVYLKRREQAHVKNSV